jgi:hypothetical protein
VCGRGVACKGARAKRSLDNSNVYLIDFHNNHGEIMVQYYSPLGIRSIPVAELANIEFFNPKYFGGKTRARMQELARRGADDMTSLRFGYYIVSKKVAQGQLSLQWG